MGEFGTQPTLRPMTRPRTKLETRLSSRCEHSTTKRLELTLVAQSFMDALGARVESRCQAESGPTGAFSLPFSICSPDFDAA
jgi:hypothetical protein